MSEQWEPLETAEAVRKAMHAGREVWSQTAKGCRWHKVTFHFGREYIAHTITIGRKYRALVKSGGVA